MKKKKTRNELYKRMKKQLKKAIMDANYSHLPTLTKNLTGLFRKAIVKHPTRTNKLKPPKATQKKNVVPKKNSGKKKAKLNVKLKLAPRKKAKK